MEERENDFVTENGIVLKCTECTIAGKDCTIIGNNNFFTYMATGSEIIGDENVNWADRCAISGNNNINHGRNVSIEGTGNRNFAKQVLRRTTTVFTSTKKKKKEEEEEEEDELEKCKEEIRLLKRALEETQQKTNTKKRRVEKDEENENEEKEETEETEEKKETEYDENTCIICFERTRSCVYIRCGHMVTCTACGVATNEKCPECRTSGPIKEVYK